MDMNNNQVMVMAERLSVDPNELHNIILNTLMPNKVQPSNEQFVSFLAIANEYKLNPLTKEIYAFPAKGGGIQAIVSIDGWLKIINSHPQFDGMKFTDTLGNDGQLISVTCCMYRKDRQHPTELTEYLIECDKKTEPWVKWPARMLRHKATIQAARYAFGFSGIVDPDEGERIQDAQEKDITPDQDGVVVTYYSADSFHKNFDKWEQAILTNRKTADEVIAMIESKGALTEEMKNQILAIGQ
jgi:phage recombination protein Bet